MIRGRVTAADNGKPLRRAQVRLVGGSLTEPRLVSTNLQGLYEFKDLAAGRYTMWVSRSGYLRLQYGQRRPLEPGRPIQLAAAQTLEKIDVALPRMSIISGRVLDELGEPVAEVAVMPMQYMFFFGRRQLALTARPAQTDESGQFRIMGLAPGDYYVLTVSRETWALEEAGEKITLAYAPTYYPGTSIGGEARRFRVGAAQEANIGDVSLIPGRAAKIFGTAFDSKGRPLRGERVMLTQLFTGPVTTTNTGIVSAMVDADGSFVLKDVTPGEYRVMIRAPATADRAMEGASFAATMNGDDIGGLALVTSTGGRMTGRLVGEDGAAPTAERAQINFRPRMLRPDLQPILMYETMTGRVNEDWTFEMSGLFGPQMLRPELPDGWAIKSATAGQRELLDSPFEVPPGEELSGVQIVLTNHVTKLSGRIVNRRGEPVTDGAALVFSTDSSKWTEYSRYIDYDRPDQNGLFKVAGLPPGEYFVVAVDYLQEGAWSDPRFLESLSPIALKITLAEAEAREINLTVKTIESGT